MEELNKRLGQLLAKEEWTEEDKKWLLVYLDNTKGDKLKSLMLEEFHKRDMSQHMLNVEASAVILDNIHKRIGVTKKSGKIPFYTLWNKWIAAAAIACLCILGTYTLVHREWRKELATTSTQYELKKRGNLINDVAPGGNKAILTLADGSTIILDDAHDGTVAHQGNTKVLKFAGKLAYNGPGTPAAERLYNTVSTPRGGEYQVILPDGSQVWLNTASSLRFPTSFNGNERRVEITGEAYFEVTKKAGMPFVVSVNTAEIRVLGTHFNVMAYDEEALLKTTLLEGSVQFTHGPEHTMLVPGQQSQLIKNGQIKVLNNVNLEEVIAWKNGMFHFERMDIVTLMRQISRWYDVEVIYANKKMDEKFFADIPRNTNLSDVLKALELTGKVQFQVEGKKVFVK
jgi:ferric-dicitrate binding protein FerR (iron transport regulator)